MFTLIFSRNDARTVNVMATACVSPVTKVRWGHMPMYTLYGSLPLIFGRNLWREAGRGDLHARLMLQEVPGNVLPFLRRFLDTT